MSQGTTYSFLDTVGAFVHPLAGAFNFGGGVANGIFEIIIENTTDRSTHSISADGVIVVNYIPGANGNIQINVQQTSLLHKFLLAWYNLVVTAADGGDLSTYADAVMSVTNVVDGGQHVLSGISPLKVPNKTYAKEQTNLTWHLMAANVSQVSF